MTSIDNDAETVLHFAHGIEAELQLIRKDGSWIRGEEVVDIFDKLISRAKGLLDQRIRSTKIKSVANKCKFTAQTEEGERGSRIIANYEDPQGNYKEYTLIGHDPNVTSLTWILEIATPPCTTLEELAWWIQTLLAISQESLPKDERVILVSTGLNPTQEYVKNLSFGEHHHILGPDVDIEVRLGVYNMFRNFIPHLIALSVNSPFENKIPTDNVIIDEQGNLRAPKCKRSIRLLKNTTQMGPTSEFEFIPFMINADREYFSKHVNRSFARMVDIYPFTDYGTIEVRVFDTQLSIPRRIGLALLLQSLALKAKRMIENGERIPDVGAGSLATNRESAVSAGLWAPFKPSTSSESEFVGFYNSTINDDGTISNKKNRFLSDGIISMLRIIRDEFEELGLAENPFMQPLLTSIFGSEFVEPKTTGADIQLKVYAESDMNMVVLLRSLYGITRECCTNWLFDPLGGRPNLPTWLSWWKGLAIEIIPEGEFIFAGQKASFAITLQNVSDRVITDLVIRYNVENSNRMRVQNDVITLTELEVGEIEEVRVSFPTEGPETAYNILAIADIAGRQINLSETIRTYWIKAGIRTASTTQFADGISTLQFSGEIETNYPSDTELKTIISVVAPKQEKVLVQVSKEFTLESGELIIFNQEQYPKLVIPHKNEEGVARCYLHLVLQDITGQQILNIASKPFYVGYSHRGPSLKLDIEMPKRKVPGEAIHGRISIVNRDRMDLEDTILRIRFKNDDGDFHDITQIHVTNLINEEFGFQWSIPFTQDLISGVIQAEMSDNESSISIVESEHIRIDTRPVVLRIESLRAPGIVQIGESFRGWLRIRRSANDSGKASIRIYIIGPDNQRKMLTEQRLKSSRDLSVSFGPLQIPDFETPSDYVKLLAVLIYDGRIVDEKTVDISIDKGSKGLPVDIQILGVPRFANPNEVINSIIQLENTSKGIIEGILEVVFDSRLGKQLVYNKPLELESIEQKLVPITIKIPLSIEMSTAYVNVKLKVAGREIEHTHKMKIKALEGPRFWVETALRDRKGERLSGFIQRVTMIDIETKIKSDIKNLDNLEVSIRILSKKDIVKEFIHPLILDDNGEIIVNSQWITPPIDVVTGYYLEVRILHMNQPLPSRAIEYTPSKFTVY